jgi:excisionase family DNA binding protein
VSLPRIEKVRKAQEIARNALWRPDDSYDDYGGPPPRRTVPIEPPPLRWELVGQGELCLGVGEAAKALGLTTQQAQAMIERGELATVPVGDSGGRLVPRSEVERILAHRPR